MRIGVLVFVFMGICGAAWAQEFTEEPLYIPPQIFPTPPMLGEDRPIEDEFASPEVKTGQGAELRLLDRITGEVRDYRLDTGDVVEHANLVVSLVDCRYPAGQSNSESFAYLRIQDVRAENLAFAGWMFASSPALSALDHPRYDVWVLRCVISY